MTQERLGARIGSVDCGPARRRALLGAAHCMVESGSPAAACTAAAAPRRPPLPPALQPPPPPPVSPPPRDRLYD